MLTQCKKIFTGILCDLAARGFVWTGLSAWIAKDALRPAMGKSNATVLAERLRRRGASRKEAGEASQLAAIAPVSKHANVHNKARTNLSSWMLLIAQTPKRVTLA